MDFNNVKVNVYNHFINANNCVNFNIWHSIDIKISKFIFFPFPKNSD